MTLPFVPAAYAAPDYCKPVAGNFRLDKGIPGGFQHINDPQCGSNADLNVFIQIVVNLIQIALQLAFFFALGMLIIGGITYIISRSRPDLIERAYNTIKYAIVGLVVIILSYTVVYAINQFIVGRLG